MPNIETERLIMRSFAPDDWKSVQALAIDKETYKRDPHDPPWPTSDEECKGFAEYLAGKSDKFYAMCLKSNQVPIGLLAINSIDEHKQLELGYQIHSEFQDNDHDKEALEYIIAFAFRNLGILSVETKTNSEWTEQIAPLRALGFTPIKGDPGNLGITRSDWETRRT